MDDFSSNFTNEFGVPPSHHNLIEPRKHPLSSMSPSIFTDQNGNIRLVIGASGGTQIPTSIALVSIRHLWFNQTIKEAIDAPRIHHQLIPNEAVYERNFRKDVLMGLKQLGHQLRELGTDQRGAIVMAVSGDGMKQLSANSDYRKGGDVDGL
jgi:gamma-glutamyltranspeptidase / glutathione hydrolase / leukotriene-C4 hydrolase